MVFLVFQSIYRYDVDMIVGVLDNIRSVHNVGSIFRTADALGFDTLYLCESTPTPIDRFGNVRNDIHKTALGAEQSVQWHYYADTEECLRHLHDNGISIIAVEQNIQSTPLTDYTPTGSSVALVMGNEVEGISDSVLALVDVVVEIPMHGTKESFNVSVAFGIAGFWIARLS